MKIKNGTAHLGDCLEIMKSIPDGSIDAIITDPPYGTVQNIASTEGIEHGMKGKTWWDDALDPNDLFPEINRILRPNWTLILFSQEPYTSRLITNAHAWTPFSYRLVWKKDHFANALLAKKAPVSYFEDIIVFSRVHPKYDFDWFHPLRPYAQKIKEFIGKSKKDIFIDLWSQSADHFFRTDSSQFLICTEKTYIDLIKIYWIEKMEWFKTFLDMRIIDSEYREWLVKKLIQENPKTFNLPEGAKYKSNILEYKKDYDGLHPTQKPVLLLEDLIKTYTNEWETVLDFTAWSFTTAVACENTNRKWVCIEKDEKYFQVWIDRLSK